MLILLKIFPRNFSIWCNRKLTPMKNFLLVFGIFIREITSFYKRANIIFSIHISRSLLLYNKYLLYFIYFKVWKKKNELRSSREISLFWLREWRIPLRNLIIINSHAALSRCGHGNFFPSSLYSLPLVFIFPSSFSVLLLRIYFFYYEFLPLSSEALVFHPLP